MSDETPVPATPPPSDDPVKAELAALKAKTAELLGEKKRLSAATKDLEAKAARATDLEAQIAKLNDVLGIKPGGPDPETIRQQRDATERASREKTDRIRDSIVDEMLSAGVKVTPNQRKAIVAGAADLEVDDKGAIVGIKEYLADWLPLLTGTTGEPVKPAAPPRMPQPKGGAQDDPMLKRFSSLADLMAAGHETYVAFRERFPERFQELKTNQEQIALNPGRRTYGATNQNTR